MSHGAIRRVPVGAELQPDGQSAYFRVWAPDPREVILILEDLGGARAVALGQEPDGYLSALVPHVSAGQRYRYRVDGDLLPDPASRAQPDGPFGPSEVIDPSSFSWSDRDWPGVTCAGQVMYEMHVGTFTEEGTWRAAIRRLPDLVRTGITLVEVMPVSEFPGQFGWGYDGVFPYAPTRLYGSPDDFRAFIDEAHRLGLAVVLDVVYNHLGPDGCVFGRFAAHYYTRTYENEWGDALNFDGPGSAAVRDYFSGNAAYWISEFHLDGLRFDATQSIHDQSAEHIIATMARVARQAAGARRIILIAENEAQRVQMIQPPDAGGYGLDALWNDDFHHSAVVALTGHAEAYYSDHRGAPQELISAAKRGYLFQGQRYAWQKQGRGTRTDGIVPAAFVTFIENHDQLANSGDGSRLHQRSAPGRYRAMTALLLLMPGTPLLFQGQEFGATTPFLYFADHNPELAAAVSRGRAVFVSQFPSLASAAAQARLAPPHARETFERCKLQWRELEAHEPARRLHADLLALRSRTAAFNSQSPLLDGAVLASEALALRFPAPPSAQERLLIVNLGCDLVVGSFPEPLVAPPDGFAWRVEWSSEHPDYGGGGIPDVCSSGGWHVPGQSATVLEPVEMTHAGHGTARG